MVNINKIQTSLLTIVGFEQPYNPKYAIVDVDNLLSDSGYYVTDNPYAKIEFIKDSQDFYKITDLQFNDLLVNLKKSAISNVVNQVFSDFDFKQRDLLYVEDSNKIDIESLNNGFVGYKIKVSKRANLAFKINRVLLDFDGIGDIDLVVWNTSSKTPIYTKTISITTDHQEEILDWAFDNSGNTYKGDYYIGYNTSGLTVNPFKRDGEMSRIANISVSKVQVVGHNTQELFNLDLVEGISQDLGLNLDISLYDDYTDFILNNKMLFSRAIQLQGIISCIQLYMASLRSNSNQSHANIIYDKILIELEGTRSDNLIYIKGLKNQLLSEISSVRGEIEKMTFGFRKAGQILVSTLR